jgi:hypothetical protein
MTLAIIDLPRPVLEAICLIDRPEVERTRILSLWEVGMDFIVIMRSTMLL